MFSKVGKYEFMAEPFHCDFTGRLLMGHLGNHLINAADFHSNDRGFGMLYLNSIHKTWVLSRLAIEMEEMPKAYDHFHVETWVESAMRFFTNRNFRIKGSSATVQEDEKVYGYGRSIWAMIDTETRQPADLLSINDGTLTNYVVGIDGGEEYIECPIAKPSRVKITDDAQLVRRMKTVYSDIDMNGHVNSIKHIEHILDLWDADWYARFQLKRLDIAYVAEAHLGDELLFYQEEKEKGNYSVRVMREEAFGETPVEICRCQVVFRM